jgi:DNA-binding MarR family transcriptional regulator
LRLILPTTTLQHELGKRQPFDAPEQEAFLNLIRTASVLTAAFQRLFRAYKLSESTYNALRILRGSTADAESKGTRTCTQIGEHLVAQVPDVTRLIDRLERLGFAERVRCDKDRRVVHVRITRKGLDVLAKLDEPVLELHRAQLGHLSGSELADLSRLLVKARQGNENTVEPVSSEGHQATTI